MAHFDGDDYVAGRDHHRLTGQILRVKNLMSDGVWRTLHQIAELTGDPESSVSAQLRNLRKTGFGSHKVERRYINNGLYQYSLRIEYDRETSNN